MTLLALLIPGIGLGNFSPSRYDRFRQSVVRDGAVQESLLSIPIRDLGLTIADTPLEPVLAQFQQELDQVGIRRLKPHFGPKTDSLAGRSGSAEGLSLS